MDGYYVPNNPTYGQPVVGPSLLSAGSGGSTSSNHQNLNQQEFLSLDCGGLLDPISCGGGMANYGYGDLDPLSSFLTFTPCSPTYKDYGGYKEKPVHDMADVLLSLKQAVLHPSGASPTGSSPLSSVGFAPPPTSSYASNAGLGGPPGQPQPGYGSSSGGSTAGLPGCGGHASYSCIYPQIQLSSNGHHLANQGVYYPSDYGHHGGSCTLGSSGGGGGGSSAGQLTPTGLHHQTAVFPASMSVNLSMNMTMGPPSNGAYGSSDPSFPGGNIPSGSQVHQWSSPSPVAAQYMVNANGAPTSAGLYGAPAPHSLQVTTYGGSGNSPTGTTTYNCGANSHGAPPPNTYTFTAEFRPTGTATSDNLVPLPPIEKEFLTTSFRPLTVNYFADTKPEILSPCKMKTRSSSRFSSPIFESSLYNHHHPICDSPGIHDPYQSENIAVESSLSPPIQCDVSSPSALNGMRDPDEEDEIRAHLNRSPGSDTGGSDDPCSPNPQRDGANGTSRTNLCRICGKTYARPSTLKTHLRTHSGERPYRCGTCNKSFSQAANLTAHIRTHSGEKPFRCPVCERRFSQSSSVTTHMRTHSGERPYRCCMCKKAFSDSSTLTKHLRIHSGEKPYQCKLCLLRFSQSGNLNRHMRVHANSA